MPPQPDAPPPPGAWLPPDEPPAAAPDPGLEPDPEPRPAPPYDRHRSRLDHLLYRIDPRWVTLAFVVVGFLVYWLSNPDRLSASFYNHFVWQAQAWLDGSAAIPYPSDLGRYGNSYFQDVWPLMDGAGNPTGTALLPFPPLPALFLVPFVALFGLDANAGMVAVGLGAINVGLCWRMLQRVTDRRDAAFLGTVFYGFGTVAWYAAMLGSTWFLAHVVASTFLFLGITAALDGERRERAGQHLRAVGNLVVLRGVAAGLLFGTAALARLTTIFGAPFFVFVGPGRSTLRRAVSAGIGAVVPVAILLSYNLVTTGHPFHPAYEYLYRSEYRPVAAFWNDEWSIEDPRYIPQNAIIMLAYPPERPLEDAPDCQGHANQQGLDLLFDKDCPLIRPDKVGMSILLTSPAYLLAVPALFAFWRRRVVAGAALAVLAIAVVNLMHFSQGWVQFGYRFSNDFAPFAVILVTLGIARSMRRGPWGAVAALLVAASVLVNAWGVWWGVKLGW